MVTRVRHHKKHSSGFIQWKQQSVYRIVKGQENSQNAYVLEKHHNGKHDEDPNERFMVNIWEIYCSLHG